MSILLFRRINLKIITRQGQHAIHRFCKAMYTGDEEGL